MTQEEIAKIRLASQHVSVQTYGTVKGIAGLMCAMQAQDYPMAKWALGIRLHGSTEKDIYEAEAEGDIIRTHLLRPTWHFVPAENIHLLLDLSAPRLKASLKSRHKELDLSDMVLKKSNEVLSGLLRGSHLTRQQVMAGLGKEGIATDDGKVYHLLLWAELCKLICSGKPSSGKPTYALLDERVTSPEKTSRESALEKLAVNYFTAHGPASLKDFMWWSGLTSREAAFAFEKARPYLSEISSDYRKYWLAQGTLIPDDSKKAFLLPAFDEFIISYADRTASLSLVHNRKAVSDNGVFRPLIVINGQVAGLWKRTFKREKVIVEAAFFGNNGRSLRNSVEEAAAGYGKFLGKIPELIFNKNKL